MVEGQFFAILCELKQVLMYAICQAISPPPQELIGRVEHYLEQTVRRIPAPTIALEEEFNLYKRYLGLE
jgi:hypothetical protein